MPLLGRHNLICLVTDRRRLAPNAGGWTSCDRLVNLVGAAAHAGVDLIQIRERDLEARDLSQLVEKCLAEAEGTGSRILVNDRTDVAVAASADGVHLRSDSVDASSVRSLVPPDWVLGRSVHTAAEALAVARQGSLDYLILGAMFPSASKTPAHPLTSLGELRQASAGGSVPVLAIGGITFERAEEVVRAGAAGVAAIGLFIPPPGCAFDRHLETCVARLRGVFDTCGALT
jgi:thiamine-phosphate pyrophosphorylase